MNILKVIIINYYTEYDLEENLSILRHKYGNLGYFLE